MTAPLDLEYKSAAVMVPDHPAMPGSTEPDHKGIVETLVAVTGVKDDVGDVIVPGAFARTLKSRKPKVVLGHDWNRPIGKVLDIKELLPGDSRLPKTTADGRPWPKEAGAVWARYQANMETEDGKAAFLNAKFFGPEESTYSIGFKTIKARHKGEVRYIDDLDLFEFGPVLHPANRLATLQSVKSGEPVDVEYADLLASWDAVKSTEPEGMTLRDYSASLEAVDVEFKARRYVQDAGYWGYPKGTLITPGMKPRGNKARKLRSRGIVPARTVGVADKPDSRARSGNAADVAVRMGDEGLDLGLPDAGLTSDARVRARNPKGKDEKHTADLIDAVGELVDLGDPVTDAKLPPTSAKEVAEERARQEAKRDKAFEGLLDEGITPNELREDLEESEALADLDPDAREAVQQAFDEYTKRYRALAKQQAAERAAGPSDEDAPAADADEKPKPKPAPKPRPAPKPAAPKGRTKEQIRADLDKVPGDSAQRVKYEIDNGAPVVDGPPGSGLFAYGPPKNVSSKHWMATAGSGLGIPSAAIVKYQTTGGRRNTALYPTTAKKASAWVNAIAGLRDADGNTFDFSEPDPAKANAAIAAWRDADGRTLAQAVTDVAVPAYLRAIGKDDEAAEVERLAEADRANRPAPEQPDAPEGGDAAPVDAKGRPVPAVTPVADLSDEQMQAEAERGGKLLFRERQFLPKPLVAAWDERLRALREEDARRRGDNRQVDEAEQRYARMREALARLNDDSDLAEKIERARTLAADADTPERRKEWVFSQGSRAAGAGGADGESNIAIGHTYWGWAKEIARGESDSGSLVARVREYHGYSVDTPEGAEIVARRAERFATVVEQSGVHIGDGGRTVEELRSFARKIRAIHTADDSTTGEPDTDGPTVREIPAAPEWNSRLGMAGWGRSTSGPGYQAQIRRSPNGMFTWRAGVWDPAGPAPSGGLPLRGTARTVEAAEAAALEALRRADRGEERPRPRPAPTPEAPAAPEIEPDRPPVAMADTERRVSSYRDASRDWARQATAAELRAELTNLRTLTSRMPSGVASANAAVAAFLRRHIEPVEREIARRERGGRREDPAAPEKLREFFERNADMQPGSAGARYLGVDGMAARIALTQLFRYYPEIQRDTDNVLTTLTRPGAPDVGPPTPERRARIAEILAAVEGVGWNFPDDTPVLDRMRAYVAGDDTTPEVDATPAPGGATGTDADGFANLPDTGWNGGGSEIPGVLPSGKRPSPKLIEALGRAERRRISGTVNTTDPTTRPTLTDVDVIAVTGHENTIFTLYKEGLANRIATGERGPGVLVLNERGRRLMAPYLLGGDGDTRDGDGETIDFVNVAGLWAYVAGGNADAHAHVVTAANPRASQEERATAWNRLRDMHAEGHINADVLDRVQIVWGVTNRRSGRIDLEAARTQLRRLDDEDPTHPLVLSEDPNAFARVTGVDAGYRSGGEVSYSGRIVGTSIATVGSGADKRQALAVYVEYLTASAHTVDGVNFAHEYGVSQDRQTVTLIIDGANPTVQPIDDPEPDIIGRARERARELTAGIPARELDRVLAMRRADSATRDILPAQRDAVRAMTPQRRADLAVEANRRLNGLYDQPNYENDRRIPALEAVLAELTREPGSWTLERLLATRRNDERDSIISGMSPEDLAVATRENDERIELLRRRNRPGEQGELTNRERLAARLRAATGRGDIPGEGTVTPDVPDLPTGDAPRSEVPGDTGRIDPEDVGDARELGDEALGLTEDEDGELVVTPEVAERQDRIERMIRAADAGTLGLATRTDDELIGTRRDIADELRLQEAVRRRDIASGRGAAGRGGTGGTTGAGDDEDDGPRAPRPDRPRQRPGLAGAAEDYAEALEGDDAAAIERTRARLVSSLRRSRSDSAHAQALRAHLESEGADDPAEIRRLVAELRAEARERRNIAARDRRRVKRLERERLRSLLGQVDAELRNRNVVLPDDGRSDGESGDATGDGSTADTRMIGGLAFTAEDATPGQAMWTATLPDGRMGGVRETPAGWAWFIRGANGLDDRADGFDTPEAATAGMLNAAPASFGAPRGIIPPGPDLPRVPEDDPDMPPEDYMPPPVPVAQVLGELGALNLDRLSLLLESLPSVVGATGVPEVDAERVAEGRRMVLAEYRRQGALRVGDVEPGSWFTLGIHGFEDAFKLVRDADGTYRDETGSPWIPNESLLDYPALPTTAPPPPPPREYPRGREGARERVADLLANPGALSPVSLATLRELSDSPDFHVRVSADGSLAAVRPGFSRRWKVVELATGSMLDDAIGDRALDTSSEFGMDDVLADLSALDIPWGDRAALERRWDSGDGSGDDEMIRRAVNPDPPVVDGVAFRYSTSDTGRITFEATRRTTGTHMAVVRAEDGRWRWFGDHRSIQSPERYDSAEEAARAAVAHDVELSDVQASQTDELGRAYDAARAAHTLFVGSMPKSTTKGYGKIRELRKERVRLENEMLAARERFTRARAKLPAGQAESFDPKRFQVPVFGGNEKERKQVTDIFRRVLDGLTGPQARAVTDVEIMREGFNGNALADYHMTTHKMRIGKNTLTMTESENDWQSTSGWWVKAPNLGAGAQTVTHELGHHMDSLLTDTERENLFAELGDALEGLEPGTAVSYQNRRVRPGAHGHPGADDWVSQNKALLTKHVSQYGTTNSRELLAELWTEFRGNPAAGPLARVAGKYMMGVQGNDGSTA